MTLPGTYVREAVELGYATTIHTAPGVTADTTHSLVDELMTREQLYTTVSRGRTANHHHILHTDIHEPTATDILQRVLRRSRCHPGATLGSQDLPLVPYNPRSARGPTGARGGI